MPNRIITKKLRFDSNLEVRDVVRDINGVPIEYTEAQILQFEIDELEKDIKRKQFELQGLQARMNAFIKVESIPTFENIAPLNILDPDSIEVVGMTLNEPIDDGDLDFFKSLEG